jgi:hypothetical protein
MYQHLGGACGFCPPLKMKTGDSFETLVPVNHTAWRHITEDNKLHVYRPESLMSSILISLVTRKLCDIDLSDLFKNSF